MLPLGIPPAMDLRWEAKDPPLTELLQSLVDTLSAYPDLAGLIAFLIAMGEAVLPIVKAATAEDLETRERLGMVATGVARSAHNYAALAPWKSDSDKEIQAVAGSPDGRHWAAVVGSAPSCQIVLGVVDCGDGGGARVDAGGGRGRSADAGPVGRLRALRAFKPVQVPKTLVFDRAGRLLAGNADGTVSIYEAPDAGE